MAETINIEDMHKELIALRKEVQLMKMHIFDSDEIMTDEEETTLKEALELHKKGKTKRYEDLRKELGD